MSKFSLFTVFLSATIVVIVAELLVNQYLKYPEMEKEITANVLKSNSSIHTLKNAAPESQAFSDLELDPKITFALIQEAGFSGISLQRVPYDGLLFGKIDLKDFGNLPVIANNLLKNNRQKLASFYEFQAGSSALANEFYTLLKDRAGKVNGLVLNETNQFGNASFYINFDPPADDVFLVVKAGDTVYALTYGKTNHSQVKQLLFLSILTKI